MSVSGHDLRIAAVVGVKDEAELLAACVQHLFAIGVDFVAVADDNSTDGSRELAERLAEADPARIMVVGLDSTLGTNLSVDGPIFGRLLQRVSADWIFICDADEFWVPRTGSLKDMEGAGAFDLLTVSRFNYAFPGPDAFHALDLTAEGLMDLPLLMGTTKFTGKEFSEPDPEERWILRTINGKVMVRPQAVSHFTLGAHGAQSKDARPLRRGAATDVLAVHLPFTTYDRFRGKVENVRDFLRRFDADFEQRAWHWRRWLKLAEEGGLPAEFERQIIKADELPSLRASGQVRSAREILAPPASVRS